MMTKQFLVIVFDRGWFLDFFSYVSHFLMPEAMLFSTQNIR